MMVALVLTPVLVLPGKVQAVSMEALQAQIEALLKQVADLQAQLNNQDSSSTQSIVCRLTRDIVTTGPLDAADTEQVVILQRYLIRIGYIDQSVETGHWSPALRQALARYQVASGIVPASGYLGPITRAHINARLIPADCGQTTETEAPVIKGISGPTSIDVGKKGTWKIKATDDDDEILSYAVNWGDEGICPTGKVCAQFINPVDFVQTATFTHTYSQAGVYKIIVMVKNSSGATAEAGINVRVGEDEENPNPVITIDNATPKSGTVIIRRPDSPANVFGVQATIRGLTKNQKVLVDLYLIKGGEDGVQLGKLKQSPIRITNTTNNNWHPVVFFWRPGSYYSNGGQYLEAPNGDDYVIGYVVKDEQGKTLTDSVSGLFTLKDSASEEDPAISSVAIQNNQPQWINQQTQKTITWNYDGVPLNRSNPLKFKVGLYTDSNGGMWGNSVYRSVGVGASAGDTFADIVPNITSAYFNKDYYILVRLVNANGTDYIVGGKRVETRSTETFQVVERETSSPRISYVQTYLLKDGIREIRRGVVLQKVTWRTAGLIPRVNIYFCSVPGGGDNECDGDYYKTINNNFTNVNIIENVAIPLDMPLGQMVIRVDSTTDSKNISAETISFEVLPALGIISQSQSQMANTLSAMEEILRGMMK
ncbi:MAG: Dockerin protein [Patescibacteria group bacterium]|nr:Dockerin protein [Patescibacteria group bacterium]